MHLFLMLFPQLTQTVTHKITLCRKHDMNLTSTQFPTGEMTDNPLSRAVAALRALNLNDVSVYAVQKADAIFGATINKASLDALEAFRPTLSPADQYPAFVAVLHASLANAKSTDVQTPYLLAAYRRFALDTAAEHAKILPHRWAGAGRHAARLAIEGRNMQQCLALVLPLRDAADKLAPSADHLVSLHVDFLAVCLEAKCYDMAARWAKQRKLQVDVEGTSVDATDVLLTYYYAGCAFTGMKDFHLALNSFRIALAVPASNMSRLNDYVVAVYKKYILLSILVHGGPPGPLRFCSYNTNRLRSATTEYIELGIAYEKRRPVELRDAFDLHKIAFGRDANLGLVKQVVKSLPRREITRLTRSFVTMRIEDVAVRAGLDCKEDAEKLLVEMIGDGSIRASLDGKDSIVRFVDNVTDDAADDYLGVPASLNCMDDNMQRCLEALKRIQMFRDSLLVDAQYIKKEAHQRRQKGSTRAGSGYSNEDAEMQTRALDAEVMM